MLCCGNSRSTFGLKLSDCWIKHWHSAFLVTVTRQLHVTQLLDCSLKEWFPCPQSCCTDNTISALDKLDYNLAVSFPSVPFVTLNQKDVSGLNQQFSFLVVEVMPFSKAPYVLLGPSGPHNILTVTEIPCTLPLILTFNCIRIVFCNWLGWSNIIACGVRVGNII